MPNGLPIDLQSFEDLNSVDAKLKAIFTVVTHMYSAGYECGKDRESRLRKCEERFLRLERRKAMDTTVSGIMGLVGGALIWVLKWMAGK